MTFTYVDKENLGHLIGCNKIKKAQTSTILIHAFCGHPGWNGTRRRNRFDYQWFKKRGLVFVQNQYKTGRFLLI
jgi:hypothetical protein